MYLLTDDEDTFTHISGSSAFEVYGVKQTTGLFPTKSVYTSKTEQVMAYVAPMNEKYILGIYNPKSDGQLILNSQPALQMNVSTPKESSTSTQTILLITLNILCVVLVVMMGSVLKKKATQKRKDYEKMMNLQLLNASRNDVAAEVWIPWW